MAKRGRKPKTERKGYFYEREEQAIVDYISSNDKAVKDEIYNTILHPAFTKMVSSIIRRYKLFVPEEEYEETFSDTLSFLMTKLDCFKPEKGYKAYSYCGTICKNYLLYRNAQYNKSKQRFESYEELNEGMNEDLVFSPDEMTFKQLAPILIQKVIFGIQTMIENKEANNLNDNEIKVGIALCELLNKWEDVMEDDGSNKLNKSTILYFLREETMMSTKELRDNMKKYKNAYMLIKKSLIN